VPFGVRKGTKIKHFENNMNCQKGAISNQTVLLGAQTAFKCALLERIVVKFERTKEIFLRNRKEEQKNGN